MFSAIDALILQRQVSFTRKQGQHHSTCPTYLPFYDVDGAIWQMAVQRKGSNVVRLALHSSFLEDFCHVRMNMLRLSLANHCHESAATRPSLVLDRAEADVTGSLELRAQPPPSWDFLYSDEPSPEQASLLILSLDSEHCSIIRGERSLPEFGNLSMKLSSIA